MYMNLLDSEESEKYLIKVIVKIRLEKINI